MSDNTFSSIGAHCWADRCAGDWYDKGEDQLINDTHDDGGKYDFAISLDNPRDAQIRGQQGDLKAEDSETVDRAAGVLDL